MKAKNKIFITGGGGLIGTQLLNLLKNDDSNIIAAPSRKELNLLDHTAVENFFTSFKPNTVIHLAAKVGGIKANMENPTQFFLENSIMQNNVMQYVPKNEVTTLIFPGSACAYPVSATQPVLEDSLFGGKIEPTNAAYGMAKLSGISLAKALNEEFGVNVIIPIITNTFGEGENFFSDHSHVIPALIGKFHTAVRKSEKSVELWGSGKPIREFIHARDVADALQFLLKLRFDGGVINVGTSEEVTISELAQIIARQTGFKGEIRYDTSKPDGVQRKSLDSSLMFSLGWRPKLSLEEGISRVCRLMPT